MNEDIKFSYIIPFKYTSDRLETLKRVIDNIINLNCDVIVVIQDDIKNYPINLNLDERVKIIELFNKYPFNKSWALNCGWLSTDNDIIVFGDADNIINTTDLLKSIEYLIDNKLEFISPHNKLIDLDIEESKLPFNDIFNIDRHGRGELDHQKLPMCGAMTIFKRNALVKIGGWCEEFFGWGAEDDAMTIKVKALLKWCEMDFKCYHLYHSKAPIVNAYYSNNYMFYVKYSKLSVDELKEYISKTIDKIGDKNRLN